MSSSTPLAFISPWSDSLASFAKIMSEMPSSYRESFDAASTSVQNIVTDKSHLHIWEADSDIDSLLQLTQVIVKIRALTSYIPNPSGIGSTAPLGMIIIAEVSSKHDHFARICDLVSHHTGKRGKLFLNDAVKTFGPIVVIKGVDNLKGPSRKGVYPDRVREEADRAVTRVEKAIEHIFAKCSYSEKKIVWHHGPIIHFLNYWIDHTYPELRNSVVAVTIHSLFDITPASITPSNYGRKNYIEDLERLEDACDRLSIVAVFADPSSQLIEEDCLGKYMYYYAYYIHTFLSENLLRHHLYLANDHLITWAFRLRAACDKKYDSEAVSNVKDQLPADRARVWAKTCIDASSYTENECHEATKDKEIYDAFRLADVPLKTFNPGPPRCFSRLTIGPSGSLLADHYICAPVDFSTATSPFKMRVMSTSPFHLWIPKPDQDRERVKQRMQGIMIGVLEILLMEKGMPKIDDTTVDADMWKAVVKAVGKSLDVCKGKLPSGVEDKLQFVTKGLVGSWSYNLWGAQG